MTEAEIRAALEADLMKWTDAGCIGQQDRSAMLDSVRRLAEGLVGQPCLARFNGDVIEVVTPVIKPGVGRLSA